MKTMSSAVVLLALANVTPVRAEDSVPVEFLNSGKIMPATLPFSEAVRVGNTLYLSGQIGIVRVTSSSGSETLDAAATAILRNAIGPAFPPSMPQGNKTPCQ